MDLMKNDISCCLYNSELKKHIFTETKNSVTIDGAFTVSKKEIQDELTAYPGAAARIKINSTLTNYSVECITAFVMLNEALVERKAEAAEYEAKRKAIKKLANDLRLEMLRAETLFVVERQGTSYCPISKQIHYLSTPPEIFIHLYQKACALENRREELGKVWVEYEEAPKVLGRYPGDYKIFIRHHTPENPDRKIETVHLSSLYRHA